MGLFVGSSAATKVYVGTTQATKVYLGATQVWPSGPTMEIFDNFNRSNRHLTADGYVQVTDGTATSNQMWISSNQVRRDGQTTGNDGTDVYIHPTSLSGQAQYAQCKVIGIQGASFSSGPALALRITGTTQDVDTAVWGWIHDGGWGMGIYTIGDGTAAITNMTNGASGSGTFADNGILRLEVEGSTARLYYNGNQLGSFTGTLPAGVRCGFNCSDYDTNVQIDDFEAGTL